MNSGEVQCGNEVRDEPWSDPWTFHRCPNVAEYLVAIRDGSNEMWVCGQHARGYGKRGKVLARATPERPAEETITMIGRWGTLVAAEAASRAKRSQLLADGRTILYQGMFIHPDGTSEVPPWKSGHESDEASQ